MVVVDGLPGDLAGRRTFPGVPDGRDEELARHSEPAGMPADRNSADSLSIPAAG
jgi:hypothetical protein